MKGTRPACRQAGTRDKGQGTRETAKQRQQEQQRQQLQPKT